MTRQPTRRGLLGINLDEAQGEISLSLTTQPGPLRTREPTRTYLVGSGRRAWVLELATQAACRTGNAHARR